MVSLVCNSCGFERTHGLHDCNEAKAAYVQTGILPAPRPLDDRPALALELTDVQLRAECERRKFGHESIAALTVQRDALVDEVKHLNTKLDECGEWRRRAEAAEGALADIPRRNAEDMLAKVENIKGLAGWLPDETVPGIIFGTDRTPERIRERGPGIDAQRPDNSIAWLDEELLCEDA